MPVNIRAERGQSCPSLPCSLYGSLLGGAWFDLHPSVRHFHQGGAALEASGRFQIGRGSTALARLVGRMLRLPPAATGVPTFLTIQPNVDGEVWHRTFGAYRLVSRQHWFHGGLLAERFGVLELRFRLSVVDGGIVYQHAGAALRLGPWLARLPRWIAPRVEAQEMPAAYDRPKTNVQVHVTIPVAGHLLSYTGCIAGEDTSG